MNSPRAQHVQIAHFVSSSRLALLALTGLLLAAATLPLEAVELRRLQQITGPSPFADCVADEVLQQDGTNYPGTEIEPWIDANPSDRRNLIAGWQQDRWSNGGSRGNVSAYTDDSGATWHTVTLPKVTLCTGGPYTRASDPWVSISPNGVGYFMNLAFDPDLPNGQFGRNAMLVSRSNNGGKSWSDPITLVEEPPGQILHDKNSLTADPNNSRFAYAVWDRLRDFTLPPGDNAARKEAVKAKAGAGDGVVAARERAKQLKARAGRNARQPAQVFFEGPIFFTRTINGGQN